jgi:hypothetical protein
MFLAPASTTVTNPAMVGGWLLTFPTNSIVLKIRGVRMDLLFNPNHGDFHFVLPNVEQVYTQRSVR